MAASVVLPEPPLPLIAIKMPAMLRVLLGSQLGHHAGKQLDIRVRKKACRDKLIHEMRVGAKLEIGRTIRDAKDLFVRVLAQRRQLRSGQRRIADEPHAFDRDIGQETDEHGILQVQEVPEGSGHHDLGHVVQRERQRAEQHVDAGVDRPLGPQQVADVLLA